MENDKLLELLATDKKRMGSAISISEAHDLQNAWLVSDLSVDVQERDYELSTANTELYKTFVRESDPQLGLVNNDGVKYAIVDYSADEKKLNLVARKTRYSVVQFTWDQLKSEPETRATMLKQIYSASHTSPRIAFPSIMVLHVILLTADDRFVITQRKGAVIHSGTWQITMSEQVDEGDFEHPRPVENALRRGLKEELRLDAQSHYKMLSCRILSLFLEAHLPNIALCAVTKLDIDYQELVRVAQGSANDGEKTANTSNVPLLPEEIRALDYVKPDGLLAEIKGESGRKYHPDTGYMLRMAYNWYFGKDIEKF